jgi:hypothetical protein
LSKIQRLELQAFVLSPLVSPHARLGEHCRSRIAGLQNGGKYGTRRFAAMSNVYAGLAYDGSKYRWTGPRSAFNSIGCGGFPFSKYHSARIVTRNIRCGDSQPEFLAEVLEPL